MKISSILPVVVNWTMVVALLIAPVATTVSAPPAKQPEHLGSADVSTAPHEGTLTPVVVTNAQHDLSLPLRVLSRSAVARPDRPGAVEAVNKILPNKHPDLKYLTALKEEGIDPYDPRTDQSIQNSIGVPYAPNAMPATILNWKAHTNIDGYYPPDTVGDIGYDPVTQKKYYVQWVNVRYAVWDVTSGTPLMVISPTLGNALWSGFGGPCQAQNDGDPIVLFDQLSNRWLMSQFAVNAAPYYQCIAISQTADPTGAWYRYAFQYDASKMNDYPHFGVWPDGYYMTANQFNFGSTWGGAGVAVFERDKMLLGQDARMVKFDLYGVSTDYGGMLPSDWDGSTLPPASAPNTFAEVDDNILSPALGPDAMRLWKFHVDWTNTLSSTFGVSGTPNYTLPVASFDAMPCTVGGVRNCVPQLGTSIGLDVIGDRLMHRAAYRNLNGHETLLINHTVNGGSGVAGIRWYEVRDPGTAPAIYQQSTYAPDSTYRWLGSVAMDHVGNIALGFSASSSGIYPSIRYAGRLAGDPLNTLAQGEATLINGTGAQTGTSYRWGDYSALTVDPVDDCTFYYSQEYLETTGNTSWVTRVGSFKFPNCSLGPQGVLTGAVTNSVTNAPIVGAQVQASSSPTATFTAYSNLSGTYNLMLPARAYTVTAAAYGFVPVAINGVAVVSGTTTTQPIALNVAPTYVFSGFVKDSATNNPLWATVSVIGTPFNPPVASVDTQPATGFYSMTIAGSQSYTLTAAALLHTAAVQGVTPAANTTVNFNLAATTQNGGVVGWVSNYYTDTPVPGAKVTVATAGNPSAQTDANGYFELLDLTPGIYTATATASLYSSVSITNIQVLSSNVAIRTFRLPTSQLHYSPAAISKTLTAGEVVTDTAGLVISNTGLGALTFELQENAGGFVPLRGQSVDYLVVGTTALANQSITESLTALGYTYQVTTETGFSALPLSALALYRAVIYASSSSTGLAQLTSYLDGGGRLLIADNDFGYNNRNSAFYANYLQATYVDDDAIAGDGSVVGEDLMAGLSANLSADPFPDQYTINGANTTRIFSYSTPNLGNHTPAGSRTTRNDYQAVYLPFDIYYLDTSAVGEPSETEVLDRALAWLGGSGNDAIPWFSETPITGTLAQDNAQNIQLVWTATSAEVPQPGTYTGTLKIKSNDPVVRTASVPVVLQVDPSATQGLLTGIVSSTGICDVNLVPINGAQVQIQGNAGFGVTLTTTSDGQYNYFVDSTQNPLTVTVSSANHATTSASVAVASGGTTTQNFALRLQQPCVQVDPTALQATLQLGTALSQTLFVTSTGATPLDFNLYEMLPSGPANAPLDTFGYTWITSTFDYIPANSSGTALSLTDDSEANIVSPFAFPFYGSSSTNLRVGNNGAILFGATIGDVDYSNGPMTSASENSIAPFWDDLDNTAGNVYWLVTGTVPNRQLIVEWYDRPHYNGVGAATFEAILYENGNIKYQYLNTDFGNAAYNAGQSATSGIRGTGLTNSVEYSYNQANLTNGLAICFVRPGNGPCGAIDIPWLSESITSTVGLTGTPPAHQLIDVTFDASQVTLPGVYRADMVLASNSPQGDMRIPVSMTVVFSLTQLAVNVVGNGTVIQNPLPPYSEGETVTLTVSPATGWSFAGWSGDLGGTTSPVTLTLSSKKEVTATFTHDPANLTVDVVGNGTVTQAPLPPYHYGDVVTLTAVPDAGWGLASWSGDLSGTTNPAIIALTGDKVVTATLSPCDPIDGVDFTYTPAIPKTGQPVTFASTAMTGTAPIAYNWNYGDGSPVGNGSPITHLFPITLTTQSYTVTMTAVNGCSTVPALKPLTVQPQTIFLPIVKK